MQAASEQLTRALPLPQNRMLIVIKSQTEALLGASVKLEDTFQAALDAQRRFPLLSSGGSASSAPTEARDGQQLDAVTCEAPQKGVCKVWVPLRLIEYLADCFWLTDGVTYRCSVCSAVRRCGSLHQMTIHQDDNKCLAVLIGTKGDSKATQHSRWRQRLSLEAQPFLEFFWLVAGRPVWEPMYKAFKADFMACFGTVDKAWHTARHAWPY